LAKAARFNTRSALTRYLVGYNKLQLRQVPAIASILELDERRLLMMCLAQYYTGFFLEMFEKHMMKEDLERDNFKLD
jgi:hypothetical protein